MIQVLLLILLFCLLIYSLYSGINKNYSIVELDLNTSGIYKNQETLRGSYDENEYENNYKNYTHLFWFKISFPESGRILKHDSAGTTTGSPLHSMIIDFTKTKAVFELKLFSEDTATPSISIERENFPINKWVHVGIVMDGDTLDLYLDSKLADTRLTNSVFVNQYPWRTLHFGKDALDSGPSIHFSENNTKLASHKWYPYSYSLNQISDVYKDEYPIYHNNDNNYEINLELSKNNSSTKFTI